MANPFAQRFRQALDIKHQQDLLRTRRIVADDYAGVLKVDGQAYLNFASNDYLGLRFDERVLQPFVEGLSKFGAGSGASPLVTGHSIEHARLESWLADKLGREAVLLFSSGFAANHALCQALLQKDDVVVSDKLMHASFIEGAMVSDATLKRFKHNDVVHAHSLLQGIASNSAVFMASEGVFSMDGDTAPVNELVSLAHQHNALLMLDDAHALGVLGDNGLGSVDAFGLSQEDCPVVMGTFGKAVGTSGAFIAGSQDLIDYLVNHAKHYIYSTAMSAANARATLASLELVVSSEQRAKLQSNIQRFRDGVARHGLPVLESHTAIQPFIIGTADGVLQASEYLRSLGLWVGAIRSPTVPKGSDRLRITLSAVHCDKDIDALLDALCLLREQGWG